ncbi:acyltransferase [Paenibacillus sp. CF384]|uniref:acyltransferase n=1 Tax=Paenibacillus sp. CF384 TaxID=1884382 RepID=UPI0008994B7F|nr:acyltransferase [Paenibacillus sp. CF384]SDX26889.1 Acetyltransferase (isoleucine patch superfamily) [Paenibacillus sp. CF384]
MKKYLGTAICLIYSLIKFSGMKLLLVKSFKFTLLNIVSPLTEVEIGRNATLTFGKMIRLKSGSKVRVRAGAHVEIGANTFLNHGCMIISHESIYIGQEVQLGPNVLIYDHDHDFRSEDGLKGLKYKTSPVEIGNNVWVGANTVILRGTKIGDNCVIGAGSIIKGQYPPNTIIVQKRETEIIEYK